jgi:hypothetical protein
MKVLKSKQFSIHKDLVEFVAQNGIQREDILTITQATAIGITLFYYAIE